MTGTAIRSSPTGYSTPVSIRPTRSHREGYEVTGTANHPLLCLVDVGGVPTLLWKLIEEIRPDDHVVIQRTPPTEFGPADWHDDDGSAPLGRIHQRRLRLRDSGPGSTTSTATIFNIVVAAYDAVVGGRAIRLASGRSPLDRASSSSTSRT